jgi:hypothetical protein
MKLVLVVVVGCCWWLCCYFIITSFVEGFFASVSKGAFIVELVPTIGIDKKLPSVLNDDFFLLLQDLLQFRIFAQRQPSK